MIYWLEKLHHIYQFEENSFPKTLEQAPLTLHMTIWSGVVPLHVPHRCRLDYFSIMIADSWKGQILILLKLISNTRMTINILLSCDKPQRQHEQVLDKCNNRAVPPSKKRNICISDFYANYFLFPWKIPEEISRLSIPFHN